jgi:hypothetical protein
MKRIFSRFRPKRTQSRSKTPRRIARGRKGEEERKPIATENTLSSVSIGNHSESKDCKEDLSDIPICLSESRSLSPTNCHCDIPSSMTTSLTPITTEASSTLSELNSSISYEGSKSSMTSHQVIQELAFMVEPSYSSEDECEVNNENDNDNENYEISSSSSSSSSSDDDQAEKNYPAFVGSFSHLDDSSVDDYIPLNQSPYRLKRLGSTLKSVSAQRLAQHHLFLATMCLAFASKQDGNTKDLRREVSSSILEHVLNESQVSPKDGRPYPAE